MAITDLTNYGFPIGLLPFSVQLLHKQDLQTKNKLYKNQQNPTYPFRNNNKEENWLIYPSFGSELETWVDPKPK